MGNDYHRYKFRYSTVEKRLQYLIYAASKRAKKSGLKFELNLETLKELLKKQNGKCFYSGLEFDISENRKYAPSIDRIDNSKGYTKDNVVLACYAANRAKGNLTLQEFIDLCKAVISISNQQDK